MPRSRAAADTVPTSDSLTTATPTVAPSSISNRPSNAAAAARAACVLVGDALLAVEARGAS